MSESSFDCSYCGKPANLVTGKVIYPHRRDLAAKKFWQCPGTCGAWVGCHPGTSQPLGRLANAELRSAKRAAHEVFDPIWWTNGSKNKKNRFRSAAYDLLAKALNIPRENCHIGMFDVALCRRTVEVCDSIKLQIKRMNHGRGQKDCLY